MTQSNKDRLKEELSAKIDASIESRLAHNQPSPKTMELFNNMQNKIISMETKINTIEEKLDKIPTREEMELTIERAMQKVLNCADKRYAGKLTEKIVYGLVGIILMGTLGVIGYLIKRLLGL